MTVPIFSIIIPLKKWSDDLDESLAHVARLTNRSFEVILLPDEPIAVPGEYGDLPISVVPTGEVSPASKRDQGVAIAQGELLVFIDDDAYPRPEWLNVAKQVFADEDDKLGAIGGPAITPKSDPFWARVSGAVFLSRFSGGFPERYLPTPPRREVDDWPSVNLIVRRDVFLDVGGFDSSYWPGEDTKLCRDIVARGWKIFYVPELVVYHHRRVKLGKHLRQVGNYGFHRGLFARLYPENSRKLQYFIPSLFVLFLLLGAMGSIVSETLRWGYFLGLGAYAVALIAAFWDITRHENFMIGLFCLPYIFLTHCWYGLRFCQGIVATEYQESLGR